MPPLEREAHRLRSLIDDADAIIVGIGSGMSSAAGFNHYNRAGMARAGMADWQQAFGFKSLFDGFYHLYPSLEQQWAYYARYIDFMLCEPASRPHLDRGRATTRSCRARLGARASNGTSASCASAATAACCCWSSAWARWPPASSRFP